MVHRTDFTSPGGPFGTPRPIPFDRRRRLRKGLLFIGFACLFWLLFVALVLGLRDIALALWPWS